MIVVHQNFSDVALWQRHRTGWIAACDRLDQLLTPVPALRERPAVR